MEKYIFETFQGRSMSFDAFGAAQLLHRSLIETSSYVYKIFILEQTYKSFFSNMEIFVRMDDNFFHENF